MTIRRAKREVSKEELEKFVADFSRPLSFDGMRYTEEVKLKGGTWNKPVAAVIEDKYFLVEDL